LQGAPKYFLDADIKGCFDNIDHEYLLGKFNTLKMFKAQIKSWLNLGIIDSKEEFSCETNEVGIPQGGVISPLLMDIALHGMEECVVQEFGRDKIKIIHYADDFVIFGRTLQDVQKAKMLVINFLRPVGLILNETKTRIRYSLELKPGGRKSPLASTFWVMISVKYPVPVIGVLKVQRVLHKIFD
jgi:RNA-directed DNA polymerase